MDVGLIIEWVVKSALLIFILLTGFAYTTLYERKLLAKIQIRLGPNRVGPGGWLQPAAESWLSLFPGLTASLSMLCFPPPRWSLILQ